MRAKYKPLRDVWYKTTNISPLAVLYSRLTFYEEVQQHLCNAMDRPLQDRINYRADLWTTTQMAHNLGYGAGNRAKRRACLLWQEKKITAEQLDQAGAKPLHFSPNVISPRDW
jgi:hypothetical protein